MKINSPASVLRKKRTWIIAAFAVIVIACIGVWFASSSRHAQLITTVDQVYDDAKSSARQISVSSNASRDKRLAAIKNLSETQIQTDCTGDWWNAWYSTVLPSANDEIKDCTAKLKRLEAVTDAAISLDAYLKDDFKVAKTLAVLKVATGSGDWQKTASSSAESALRDIEAIAVMSHNKVLIDTSKEKVLAIITKWNALNEASSKEDRAAYQKGEAELAQAYADLGAISDISDEQVEKSVASLQAAANKL